MIISPILAILTGSDVATALGITAQSSSPVLELCRRLIAAGHDPRTPLHVYRRATLALHIRSIGEGARLEVAEGVGFRRYRGPSPSPLVRKTRPARPKAGPQRRAAVCARGALGPAQ